MSRIFGEGQYVGKLKSARTVAGIRLAETTYQPDLAVPSHAHGSTVLSMLLAGRMTEIRLRQSVEATPGTLIAHPKHEPHGHQFHEEGGRLFVIELGMSWAERMAELGVANLNAPLDLTRSRANAIAGQIYEEFRTGDEASTLSIEGFALAMLAEFNRARHRDERSVQPRWLRHAVEILHANAGGDVDMAAIAATVGVHPVHLSRTFRLQYGMTMGEYLRRHRIARARAELLSTDKPISQIALEAGFADQAHFSRSFKRLVGVTPGEFRRQGAR